MMDENGCQQTKKEKKERRKKERTSKHYKQMRVKEKERKRGKRERGGGRERGIEGTRKGQEKKARPRSLHGKVRQGKIIAI